MKMTRFLIIIFSLIAFDNAFAQVTIKGKVIDAHSQEAVPFANIYLPENPTAGTSADFDGIYELTLPESPDSLAVSALGYDVMVMPYNGGAEMNFKLAGAAVNLKEVVVKAPGKREDPAYALLKKVIANKNINNIEKLPAYTCEVYNKIEMDLVNVSDEFKNMKLNRPFKFVFDYIDSTSEELPFLPLFLAETMSDIYVKRAPKAKKEIIKASKVVGGLENESVSRLLGVMDRSLNVYDNWIAIVGKDFISPIADNGAGYYRYYLVDSNFIDNKWCYQIQYFPKIASVNAFEGDFWIHDSTYAVKRMNMQLFGEKHFNYIERLSFVQNFTHVNDSVWMPEKDYITVTTNSVTEPFFGKLTKKMNENAPSVQGKRTSSFRKYSFSRDSVENGLNQETTLAADALKKDEEFWGTNRHNELSQSEANAYFLIDTIKNLPVIETWERAMQVLFAGYWIEDYFEIGNMYTFYSANPVEGSRFKFGGISGEKFSEKLLIGAYGAYGLKDKTWKYGGRFLYLFNNLPRQSLRGSYVNDLFLSPNLGSDLSAASDGILSTYLFRRQDVPFKILDVEQWKLTYHHEWELGFSFKLGIANQEFTPKFNFAFYPSNQNQESVTSYINTEVSVEARFAYREKFVSGTFYRASLGSAWPIVALRYNRGLKDFLSGDLDFHKLEMNIRDKVKMGFLGYTRVDLTGGKVWGRVPYLNMHLPKGNEGIFLNTRGFNLMNEYTFAADKYLMVIADHHFDGLFLQMIPIFKKWRWRSVANFRAFMGDMTAENRLANELNLYENTVEGEAVRLRVPNKKPYMEFGAGIENIFRFFRVEAVWKLSYFDLEDTPKWGIRMNMQVSL